ncbi:MAG TPA: CbiX/SirB N-terminal domain-containing protein [Rhodopila sp.]|nr:CbiX/SirB N-terminal domain-containing protein [Rhodopila sp.]
MLANEALLLISHGSARYADAADAIRRHAESLWSGGHFDQVEVAVLNGTPSVAEALRRIDKPLIRVVPLFMEDGYFTGIAVPRAIAACDSNAVIIGAGRVSGTHDIASPRRIVMCPPVGVHDGMAGVIERQALAACADLGIPSRTAAVVVVGHGSASAPGRNLALHRHAARVASTTLFGRAEAACLEEAPFLPDTLAMLRAHPVIVIGFFANSGGHARDDVPGLVAAERQARGTPGPDVRFHGSVIDDPAIPAIVLDQATGVPAGE